MPQRSTPRPVSRNASFYSDDALDRIIEAGGGLPDDDREVEVLTDIDLNGHRIYERAKRREALRACLEGAARQYTRDTRAVDGHAPTSARLAERYAAIEKTAQRSVKALGKRWKAGSNPDRIDTIIHSELGLELASGVPSLEAMSGSRVQELIRDNEDLLRCATRLRKKYSVEPTAGAKRHSGNVPLNELLRWLGHAWFIVFENSPGTSVNEDNGAVAGPFIRFVRATLEPLVEGVPTNKALRARIRRVLPSLRAPAGMAKSD